jgi:hypothetical protein
MSAGGKQATLALAACWLVIFALGTGCGKNVIGPTAPKLAAESELMTEGEALQNYSAVCHNPGRWFGPRAWIYEFMLNCTPMKILELGDNLNDGYFNDPAMLAAFKRVTTAKLFYIIMFNHGAGFALMDTAVQILSTGWSPRPHENPGAFPHKVTLMPYDWDRHHLFHGGLHDGWEDFGTGYGLAETGATGQTLSLQTGSLDGDIYKNNGNFYTFAFNYMWRDDDTHWAYFMSRVACNGSDHWAFFDSRGTWLNEDGQTTSFDSVHFSTVDKSGQCHISSIPDSKKLNIWLDFNPDGSGGGTMDIKNVHGVTTHYEYSQAVNGHGWWTKNNGKKNWF